MSTGKYCDSFDERLLDLLYGELAAEEDSSLREHAADCPRCAAALAELELDRSMFQIAGDEEPPSGLDTDLIEQASRQAAAWAAEQKTAARVEPSSWLDRAQGIFDRLVGVALHPAFVSASVLLVITILAVFIQRQGGPFRIGPVTEEPGGTPVHRPEAPESPAIAEEPPLEPVQKKTVQPEEPVASPIGPGAAIQQPVASQELRKGTPAPSKSVRAPKPKARTRRRAAASKKAPARHDEVDDLLGRAPGAGAAPSIKREESKSSKAREKTAPKAELGMLDLDEHEPVARPSTTGGDFAASASAREAAPAQAADPLTEGTEAYHRGNCSVAEPLLGTASGSTRYSKTQRSGALFMLGECARRRGRCSTAIRRYEELLRLDPSSRQAPEALYKAAVCHRRLGQDERAIEKLNRLRQVQSWQTRADTLLQELQ